MLVPCLLAAQAVGAESDHFIAGAAGDSSGVVYPARVPLESKGSCFLHHWALRGMAVWKEAAFQEARW